jgi:hypothetical protein
MSKAGPHKDYSLGADEWAIVLDKVSCEIVYNAIVHKESWLLFCNYESYVVVRHPSGNPFPFEFVKAQILAGWKWMKSSKNGDQRCENSGYRSPARLHQHCRDHGPAMKTSNNGVKHGDRAMEKQRLSKSCATASTIIVITTHR